MRRAASSQFQVSSFKNWNLGNGDWEVAWTQPRYLVCYGLEVAADVRRLVGSFKRETENFHLPCCPIWAFSFGSPGRKDQPLCRGVSPRWQSVAVTSPRRLTYSTSGDHESRASQVIPPRTSPNLHQPS